MVDVVAKIYRLRDKGSNPFNVTTFDSLIHVDDGLFLGVTVAQQILVLLVGVRIPEEQRRS